MSFDEGCAVVLASVFVICLALFLVPAIELWLWGLVMIPVFGAPALTYWQMFALNWLCSLLFGFRVSTNSKK